MKHSRNSLYSYMYDSENTIHFLIMKSFKLTMLRFRAFQVALVVRNLPANEGDIRDTGSIPGSGRSPEGGHGNPLQYYCLGNPMDKGAWWDKTHGVAKTRTQLSD